MNKKSVRGNYIGLQAEQKWRVVEGPTLWSFLLLVQLYGRSTSSCHPCLGASAPHPAQTHCQHPLYLYGISCPEQLLGSGLQLHRDFRE